MGKSPERDRAPERGRGAGETEPPPTATSLVLVGSLQKADGEQELVRVTAKVDAPLDATCIRRVRKLLEALTRTILSRDRSRWDRIDEARELLTFEDAGSEATTERNAAPEAQTERRLRVPSDGAPMSAGLHSGAGLAEPLGPPDADRAESPTRRVRIAPDATAQPIDPAVARGTSSAADPAPLEIPAPLPPPPPKPSPWVTATASANAVPATAPPRPFLRPEPPRTDHSQSAGTATACFDDGRVFTVAAPSPSQPASPLPFRQAAPQPAPAPPLANVGAALPAGPVVVVGPAQGPAADDLEPATISVESISGPRDRPSAPRSTARERQSEPIEQTLARLARAAGEAITPFTERGGAEPAASVPSQAPEPARPPATAAAPPAQSPALGTGRGGQDGATMAAPGLMADDESEGLSHAVAAMTVEQYALLCVETATRPPYDRPTIHQRHQISSERERALLDRRWQARLAADETLAQQWRWHYARHEQALKR